MFELYRDVKEHIEKLQEEREEEARVKKEKEVEKRKQKVCFIHPIVVLEHFFRITGLHCDSNRYSSFNLICCALCI